MIVLLNSAGIPCCMQTALECWTNWFAGTARSDQSSGCRGARTTVPPASASWTACRSSASSDSSSPMCLLYATRSEYVAMFSQGLVWLVPTRLNGRIGLGTAVVAADMEARCMRKRVIVRSAGRCSSLYVGFTWMGYERGVCYERGRSYV
jgi:hypothetical protein